MDLSKKKCGECGAKSYARKNLKNLFWKHPWKDYPTVLLTKELVLWTCQECGNAAITPGDAAKIDLAVETSVRDQASQFLDIVKSKSGLSFEEIGGRLGIAPSYLSSLRSEKKTPSFHLWTVLKVMAMDPKEITDRMDPNFDIVAHNILLRA